MSRPADPAPPRPPSTVLIAWEAGGGLGHLTRDLLLGSALAADGHRVVFAVRDLAAVDALLPREHRVLQAPLALTTLAGWPAPADYAEILLHLGFGDAPGLAGRVRAWRAIYDLAQVDLVVADHAPTAVLAARCADIPAALFGNGFLVPPPGWPPFRPLTEAGQARRAQAAAHVLTAINACLRQHRRAELDAPSRLFDGARRFLCTYPELDHYHPRADPHPPLGPLFLDDFGDEPDWPQGEGPRVFAYLRPELGGIESLMDALARLDARVLVRCGGAAADRVQGWSSPRLRITPRLIRMASVAAQADLVVCSGGDTLHSMAVRGVPVLGIPNHAEQAIAIERLCALGLGEAWVPDRDDAAQLGMRLRRLLEDPAQRARCAAFAQRHSAHDSLAVIDAIAAQCGELLAVGRSE